MEPHDPEDKPVVTLRPLPSSVANSRIPAWNLSGLARRGCPVCGADRAEPLCKRPDQLLVGRCGACGMAYLPEIPAPADLDRLYADYAQYKGMTRRKLKWWPTRQLWWANPNIMILEHTGGLRGQKVCDMGCAEGSFLLLARRRGAEVFGVELDQEAIRALSERKIPAAASLPGDRQFDVLTAFQVIEHLPDPAAWVRSARAAVGLDGRLLLALPNGGEIDRVGPTWVGFRQDLEHLNYFSIATLSRLLADNGFYVEQYWETLQAWLHRTPPPGLLRQTFRYIMGRMFNHPFYIDGRQVLTVLARKV